MLHQHIRLIANLIGAAMVAVVALVAALRVT
jgi:hypothetical protein